MTFLAALFLNRTFLQLELDIFQVATPYFIHIIAPFSRTILTFEIYSIIQFGNTMTFLAALFLNRTFLQLGGPFLFAKSRHLQKYFHY